MPFDPDAIARLSPAARVEVQDFYARKFLAERRVPAVERRMPRHSPAAAAGEADAPAAVAEVVRPARVAWPRVWFRNDSSRPTSFPHRWPPPFRPRGSQR